MALCPFLLGVLRPSWLIWKSVSALQPPVCLFTGKWRKITSHIFSLHHQQFFLFLLWTKLSILKVQSCPVWTSVKEPRIALAGSSIKDNENQIFCLLLNWCPVLTHSPWHSFGNLLLLTAGKWMTFRGNFNVWEVCKHKVPFAPSLWCLGQVSVWFSWRFEPPEEWRLMWTI